MKKLLTLLLAAGLVISAANGASAVDIKVSGTWLTTFSFTDGLYGSNALRKSDDSFTNNDGAFNAAQRIRINFDLIAGESLSGRVQLQVANSDARPNYYSWGVSSVGGPGNSVTARLAYLDWNIPSTDVRIRMGRQEVTLPGYAFLTPVLSGGNPADGVTVHAPINDMVAVNVGWLRAAAEMQKWGTAHNPHSSFDLAYLTVDVSADGFKVTPWGMIGFVGPDASDGRKTLGKDATAPHTAPWDAQSWSAANKGIAGLGGLTEDTVAYWVGIGGELTLFDPFKFTADFMYSGNDADGYAERRGWYAALGAEVKLSMATPFLRGWYASGDDADSGESGRMLTVGAYGAWDASSIYFDANGRLNATIDRCSPDGTWGAQLGVKNVSFIEDLSHALSLTYVQGTNNTNRVTDGSVVPAGGTSLVNNPVSYMTTADSLWEVDFLSSYKLYKNLTANLLLACLITDFDEDIRTAKYDNGFRGSLNFTYNF